MRASFEDRWHLEKCVGCTEDCPSYKCNLLFAAVAQKSRCHKIYYHTSNIDVMCLSWCLIFNLYQIFQFNMALLLSDKVLKIMMALL